MLLVCIMFLLSFFAIDFCKCFLFHALSWFIDTVCLFKYYFASCAVLLICWFFLILCSHLFSKLEGYVISGEIVLKIAIIIVNII